MLSSVSLHSDANIALDENGGPAILSCNDLVWGHDFAGTPTVDVVIREPNYIRHYFHFVELSVTLITVLSTYMPETRIGRIYFGRQVWNNDAQNFVQRDIVQALFNPQKIVEGSPDGEDTFSKLVVLLEDRCGPIDAHYNKYFASAISQSRRVFPEFKSKAIAFSATDDSNVRSEGADATLYVKRGPPRTFSPELEIQFLQKFRDYGFELVAIDFSKMTWAEQVKATSRARLLVGIHGNGLTNCLWMPAGATVIEIFPPGAHHYDYQMLSEVAELNYFGIEARAQNPFIFTSGSRFGSPYGLVNEPITELPWPWLDQILDGLTLPVKAAKDGLPSARRTVRGPVSRILSGLAWTRPST